MRTAVVVITLVLLLDQASKQLAELWLVPYQSLPLLPSLNLTLAYNTGAAFSFLSDAGGWQRWFFVGLAIVVIAVLATWLRQLAPGQMLLRFALSLVIGGAAGNLVDRVLYGKVVDFIDVYYGTYSFPAFNLADSAITVGACLFVLDTLLEGRRSGAGDTQT